MELLYIWIEDYKNIHHQGFNFSPKYRFEFDYESGEIFYKMQDDSLKHFFPNNINNVTALIGENGSGKSSIIEIIRDIIPLFNIEEAGKFVVIIKFYEYYLIPFLEDNTTLSIENATEIIHSSHLDEVYADSDNCRNSNIIYYSNVFDGSLHKIEDELNISTNHIVNNAVSMDTYRFDEIEGNLNFIYDSRISVPFITPKKLTLSLIDLYDILENHYIPEKKLLRKHKLKDYEVYLDIFFINLKNEITILDLSTPEGLKSYLKIYFTFLEFSSLDLIEVDLGIQNNIIDSFKNYIDPIQNVLSYFKKYYPIPNSTISEKLENMIRFIDDINDKNFLTFEMEEIKIHIEKKDLTTKFLTLYRELQTVSTVNFFTFNWIQMSSGEKAWLNLYSRFWKVKNEIDSIGDYGTVPVKELIVIIDEGETYYHPAWQKAYLNNLFDLLNHIFDKMHIHVILTSNSPFIASDLPSSHILFLEKGKDGKFSDGTKKLGKCIVIDGLKDKKQTFGANIHTLLSNSFFLQDGLMGDFAKIKINQIIIFYKRVKEEVKDKQDLSGLKKEYSERKKGMQSKREAFWNIQNIIGEEYLAIIIKNHLEELDLILLNQIPSNEDRLEQYLKLQDITLVEKVMNKLKKSYEDKQIEK